MGALASANDLTTDQQYILNNNMGQGGFDVQLGDLMEQSDAVPATSTVQVTNGTKLKRVVRMAYDAGQTTMGATGTYELGPSLPPKALLTSTYFEIIRPFTSVSGANPILTIHCGGNGSTVASGAYQILNPSDLAASTVGQVAFITPQAQTATQLSTKTGKYTGTTECKVRATVTTNSFNKGKLVLFTEYVVTE